MKLSEDVKLALDDVRALMLGTQILFGFQFQLPFQTAFAQLSAQERHLEFIVLLLILVTIALLIAPGSFHRITEHGNASDRMLEIANLCSTLMLPIFCIALAIDLYVAFKYAIGFKSAAGVFAFTALLAMAAAIAPWLRGKTKMSDRHATEVPPLAKRIEFVLTEARIILPGAQALLGFQLIIIFSESFAKLLYSEKMIHGTALGLIASSTLLLMAPAAVHRIAYNSQENPRFVTYASGLLSAATLFLAVGIAVEVRFIGNLLLDSATPALLASLASAILLIGIWHVWPMVLRFGQGKAR
ncbi:DUF6328 family protein [Roseiarcaceae bacterium H3SJ34-1]|uniref:DUF6328 family protein n=1 Tax=Terripilifer ovatus TaxID=3032367 RepID=UPI003AB995B5|nr:DUF6328 family protein [Roseiarcaceae bacterium H3SJ34-1]